MLSPQDVMVLLAVGFLTFGASRLPLMARAAGDSVREFKKGLAGEEETPPPPKTPEA